MKTFLINEDLIKGLLNYLLDKPYKEVWQGVVALQNLPEYKDPASKVQSKNEPVNKEAPTEKAPKPE